MTKGEALLVMGVAGSGKSTVGRALAERLGWELVDADDLHPPANVAKMARGEPLTEADRRPWLSSVAALLQRRLDDGASVVLACSALSRASRRMLRLDARVQIVLLELDAAALEQRLARRKGHFFPPDLLASQIATLEPPPHAIRIDAAQPIDTILDAICAYRA